MPWGGGGRDTGQWEGGLKSGPRSFKSQALVPARGRGAVLTSHLLTKASASRKGNPQFPEGNHKGWWRPALGPAGPQPAQEPAAKPQPQQTVTSTPPPSRPAHQVERHPTPSLRATAFLFPLPVSSGRTPVSTEATCPLQVQKTCSSAIRSRVWPTPPKMCSG